MAVVAKAKQGKTEVRRGTWLSSSGQLSYGIGAAEEIMIEMTVYETLKSLSLSDRSSYYQAKKEKKPEIKQEVS